MLRGLPTSRINSATRSLTSTRAGAVGMAVGVGALATAAYVEYQSRRADRDHPPTGQFIDVDGVHLHYLMRGEGPVVVLLHGNTVTSADFVASGLMSRLGLNHRVIAFDRPGFGHSSRPRDRHWTLSEQSALIRSALSRLGVEQAVVLGHSLGAMVAMTMAIEEPARVQKLILLGGYFYPNLRVDALAVAPLAVPVLGDVMRYTVAALASRALLGATIKLLFSPMPVPPQFWTAVPREIMLRPLQVRASSEDGTFMVPGAEALSKRYYELRLPITLIAGAGDQIIDPEDQSVRLHEAVPHSDLHMIQDAGHMVHHHHQALALIVKAVSSDKDDKDSKEGVAGESFDTVMARERTSVATPS